MYHARPMAFYAPSGSLSGPQIRLYQWVLANLLFLPDTTPRTLDGIQGPQTTAALRAYQASERLPQTGVFDAATVAALNRSIDAELASGHLPPVSVGLASTAMNPTGVHAMLAGVTPQTTAAAPARRPAAVGTHPKVNTIATSTGTVAVPEAVSKMIPPATVATLQTMTAPQAQSFVNDLSSKVATGQVSGNELIDGGTGKNVEVTAVPMVSPNGTVTAALATQPAGWWAGLTDNEKAAWVAGGTLGGVALIAGIVWLAKGK